MAIVEIVDISKTGGKLLSMNSHYDEFGCISLQLFCFLTPRGFLLVFNFCLGLCATSEDTFLCIWTGEADWACVRACTDFHPCRADSTDLAPFCLESQSSFW